ncbi:hypothetical protein D915_008111 [Fasciola hepatica]|uniref:Uncharacterized protein n=1 Tax=Fasciola hepatica TaxID=6192 RepID=A0A4E0R467_FASHE|nr:hypothetical protein D915_008111 [Fasciola hepatica]
MSETVGGLDSDSKTPKSQNSLVGKLSSKKWRICFGIDATNDENIELGTKRVVNFSQVQPKMQLAIFNKGNPSEPVPDTVMPNQFINRWRQAVTAKYFPEKIVAIIPPKSGRVKNGSRINRALRMIN